MKSFHLMKADKSASEIDRSAFFFKIHEKKLDKGGGGGYNNRALESPAQLRPEAQIFFPKVEKSP